MNDDTKQQRRKWTPPALIYCGDVEKKTKGASSGFDMEADTHCMCPLT